MLTFSEALVHIKSGQAVKWGTWQRGRFVRIYTMVSGGVMSHEARYYTPTDTVGVPYIPTQAELFGQSWSLA